MLILGIETSCDETSFSVVEDGYNVIANVTHSQILDHAEFGGVIPELASRKHVEFFLPVLKESLKQSNCTLDEIDAIAVTRGPGLLGALLVGVNIAKTLGFLLEKPCIPVDHLVAHLYAPWLGMEKKKDIFHQLVLTVSGGHTSLVLMKGHGDFELLGQTLDDAAGEAFDKVAVLLDLGYPGGPVIDSLAKQGNPEAYPLPRAMKQHKNFHYSFSGLKSAVLRLLQQEKEIQKADMAASFQEAVVDSLLIKLQRAYLHYKPKGIVITGGVSANSRLRQKAIDLFDNKVSFPPLSFCTDNAAMVAGAGFYIWENTEDKKKFTWENVQIQLESELG